MLARISKWGWCLLGTWLLWLLAPIAAAASGDQLFAQGVSAFKNGNFASALRYFQQARAAGFDLPTLYYNLGASLYKLGRYADAEEAFRACARDPVWAPLAYYNAGLSAYRRDQRTAAADYFERAARTTDSDQIRALAVTMLERIDAAAARRPRGALAWNLGYNDNVTLTSDNQTLQTTSESDRYSELLVSATGRWGQDSRTWRWDASLYDLRYAHLSDNNITSVELGLTKPATVARWHTEATGQWDYVVRNGQRFLRIGSLQFDGSHDLPDHGDLSVSVQLSTIDTLDDNYAFLDGSQQELDVSASRHVGNGQARLGMTFERNRRADLVIGDEFYSFSPFRYGLWFVGSWPIGGYWRIEPFARYTHSRYTDPDIRTSGVVATRKDDEKQLSLQATYRLTAVWRLLGAYSYDDNQSNFIEFSYRQRIVWVGVRRRL